jgi:RNA polymerase sigma-70 factor (ECF subfamily)
MQAEGFRDLVNRAQAGDQEALNRLLKAAQADLLVRARKYVTPDQPEASASDLVQSACLRAWQHLDKFRCGPDDEQTLAQFRAWLLRILQRLGLNAIRFRSAQRRRPAHKPLRLAPRPPDEVGHGPNALEPAGAEATPSSHVRAAEEALLLRQALARMPPADRTILELRFFEGLSLRQVAARVQLSEDKVRQRYHFSLRRLERELGGVG